MSKFCILYAYILLAYWGDFLKLCPFCKAELPEEAIYCLNCASVLNERQNFPVIKEKKERKKLIVAFPRKRVISSVAVVLSLAIVISSCLFAYKLSDSGTTEIKEKKTTLIPVTEENGESVTDQNGEQIFEIIEITETTTEKQGLLDKIFGKDETEKSDNASETTTKKQSFLEKLFGDEENTTSSTTTEPEATTKVESSTEATTDESKTSSTSTTEYTTESTTNNTANEDTTININDFEYTELNGKIKITKYTGNASTVTVPAYIDGKHVAYLGENAFANNSSIQKIVFTGTESGTNMFYLPISRTVFYNLPNLTSITLPYETHYRMVYDTEVTGNNTFYELIVDCPKLSGIYFTDKVNSDYSSTLKTMYSVDGVVCSQVSNDKMYGQPYRDSYLMYYPPAKTDTQYTIPSRVYQIEKNAFKNNSNIKSIHFGVNTRYIKSNFFGCNNLVSFTVDKDHAYLFVENDVLYTGGLTINNIVYRGVCYPPAKKDTTFEFTKSCNILLGCESFGGNPYLQTIKCPMSTYIDGSLDDTDMPPALTTIMLKEDNTNSIQVSKSSFNFVYY